MKIKEFFFDFAPAILIVLVNLTVLAVQCFLKNSPMAFWGVAGYSISPNIFEFYIACSFSIFFGCILGNLCTKYLSELRWYSKNADIYLFQDSLRVMIKVNLLLLFLFIGVTQYYLGPANLLALWSGEIIPEKIELALLNSPFGLNGLLQILALAGIVLWTSSKKFQQLALLRSILLIMISVAFLSQGKAKGMTFLIFAFVFNQHADVSKKFISLMLGGLLFLMLFYLTRVLRTQAVDMSFEENYLGTLIFGFYTGSPFYNTCYILDHLPFVTNYEDFYKYMIPQRLFHGDLIQCKLPDISSPSGLFGNGLMLGSKWACMAYLVAVGFLSGSFMNLSKKVHAIRLFIPFLLVASAFSFLVDHFTNFMMFWIPLVLCFLISKLARHRI